ncbi:hypothetical protein PHYPSEUDO_012550 [Phytophthora pseudosyringae]|uniref:Uncharacterized protein n=1 Tax=Phytophthora pseudosyringae TaxID=221518 RepID=A0A8T1V6K1_9STRA|nr:hypothetical protein PHYPSEUDO_012550 [Phytophthora pseudosyringae]
MAIRRNIVVNVHRRKLGGPDECALPAVLELCRQEDDELQQQNGSPGSPPCQPSQHGRTSKTVWLGLLGRASITAVFAVLHQRESFARAAGEYLLLVELHAEPLEVLSGTREAIALDSRKARTFAVLTNLAETTRLSSLSNGVRHQHRERWSIPDEVVTLALAIAIRLFPISSNISNAKTQSR